MPETLQIAIVGGGIGGLTAALALRARGLNVTVFEQADELREIGAGVTIFPNATLLLHRIGLGDEIASAREIDSRVCLSFSNGATVNSDIVIGADGIHSTVQREIGLETYPSSEGIMAYRGLIPTEKLSWAKDIGGRMSRWIGEGRPVLPRVERPINEHGRFCPHRFGFRGITDRAG